MDNLSHPTASNQHSCRTQSRGDLPRGGNHQRWHSRFVKWLELGFTLAMIALGCLAPLPNVAAQDEDAPYTTRVSDTPEETSVPEAPPDPAEMPAAPDDGVPAVPQEPSGDVPADAESVVPVSEPVALPPSEGTVVPADGTQMISEEPVPVMTGGPVMGEDGEPSTEAGTPHSLARDSEQVEFWELGLDEAIHYALSNSKVLRDLGGTILSNPLQVRTNYLAGIVSSDPRFGIEAALSAFDAKFTATGDFQKNKRFLNNSFLGGGTNLLYQDLETYQFQLSKQAATGTEFFVGNFTDFNSNNATANQYRGAWNSNIEVGGRQPLLQGAGVDFNRIAGPKNGQGVYNGVLIARVNTKISQAEFEVGLRNFVSNVTNTYWDLYFAYRDLDAKIKVRDAGLAVWRKVEAQGDRESANREAMAQEQYYRFEEEVQNSLSGRQFDGTRTNNGTLGGTFRGNGGVYVSERRLRLLMGVPISDQRLIRPTDEPEVTEILYNWDMLSAEALERRPELKAQRLLLERREMELIASRNFLKPRFDLTGRYRFRGFGNTLGGGGSDIANLDPAQGGPYSSAWGNLFTGQQQEWQLGFEAEVPLGFRKAHAGVHNAELLVARDRTVLKEQERQVLHDLSQAVSEKDRAYAVVQTNLKRYRAARKLLSSLEKPQQEGRKQDMDTLLDAQRRLADAEMRYFLSRVEYALALKNVNYEKGSLLDYYDLIATDNAARAAASPVPAGQVVGTPANR